MGHLVQTAQQDSVRLLRGTLIAAIMVPLALFLYVCWLDYQSVTEVADKQIVRTTDVVNEHALKVFEAVERSIGEIAEIIRDQSDNQISEQQLVLHDRLKRIVASSSQIKSLWIFDKNGKALVNSLIYPSDDTNFSDRDYFLAHVEKDIGIYVGKVLQPRAQYTGAAFFGISQRRPSLAGSFNGVIQASILPDYFEGFYQKIARDPGAYASIVREDGWLLARYPSLGHEAKLAEKGPLYQAMLTHPGEGKVTLLSAIDGEARTVSYRKLQGFPVFVLAGLATSAIWDQWWVQVRRKLLFGAPATAALVALVALALRRTRRFYAEATARQAAETALKQAQRLETLGQLTGGVAHDFNNLLMVVGGSAQRIRSRMYEPRLERPLSMIETAVQRGTSLTRQLLSFSRRQSHAPKVIDVGACVRGMSDVLRQSLRSDIRVRFSLPEEVIGVSVDQDEFEIALMNLVINARDAMPVGGEITIAIKSADVLGGEGSGQQPTVIISVSDSGVGIPADIKDRVFEPFFTTKSPDKGTGLGLSQVYGFARQSGGSVNFESKESGGTTFVLALPRSYQPIDRPAVTPATPAAQLQLRVLLVEDNPQVAAVAFDYLIECGCTVLRTFSAEEAIEALANDSNFDVVFSDIVMPGMNGVDLARWVRSNHPRINIVLASGYSDKTSVAQAEGFVLINKPYSFHALRSVLTPFSKPQAA